MPDSKASRDGGKVRAQPEQKRRARPAQTAESGLAAGHEVVGQLSQAVPGSDLRQGTFERHAALLGDSRMAQPMYHRQRAAIVMQLQRDYGNRYVQRLVDHISRRRAEAVQAKLTVGPAGDKYEQEADQVAKQVMETASSQGEVEAQRQEEEELQMKPLAQPQVSLEGGDVDREVENTIQQVKGAGQALPKNVRSSMEGAFGADFSGVRVHSDSEADALNASMSARAFTTGQDIFIKRGEYNPGSSSGQELLAHELTHVVQQTGSEVQRQCSEGQDLEEVVQTKLVYSPLMSVAQRHLLSQQIQRDIDGKRIEGRAKNIASLAPAFLSSLDPLLRSIEAYNTNKNASNLAAVQQQLDKVPTPEDAEQWALKELPEKIYKEMETLLDSGQSWAAAKVGIRSDAVTLAACFDLCRSNQDMKAKLLYRLGGDADWKRRMMAQKRISHNEFRKALVSLGVFEEGKAGHKTGAEVDKLIATHLKDYVEEYIGSERKISGSIAVVGAADWDVIGREVYGSDTWDKGKKNTLNAFVDSSFNPPRVFVNKDRGNAGTAIHEACHRWSDDAIKGISHDLDEGITEYFARKICGALKIPRAVYEAQYLVARALVGAIGEDKVAEAYFDGNVNAIKHEFLTEDPWTFFVSFMNGKDWHEAWNVVSWVKQKKEAAETTKEAAETPEEES